MKIITISLLIYTEVLPIILHEINGQTINPNYTRVVELENKLPSERLEKARNWFYKTDNNKDEKISWEEYSEPLWIVANTNYDQYLSWEEELEFQWSRYLLDWNHRKKRATNWFESTDKNGDGRISLEEFPESAMKFWPLANTDDDNYNRTDIGDPIDLAQYGIDTYPSRRIWFTRNDTTYVAIEGNVFVGGSRGPTNVPYPIPYRSITPQRNEVTNLLVPVLFSASHFGYASARMEPTFMIAGESAVVAAVQAIEEGVSVQDIDMERYLNRLRELGQRLDWNQVQGKNH